MVVLGAPRLKNVATGDLYPVGFLNTIQYTENRQVQPLKTIGSRRHIFAATNSPVQGSIGRMLFLGENLYRALHAYAEIPSLLAKDNTYAIGGDDAAWFTNAEEDLFRIPFGMGIIYNSPASLAGKKHAAAEYFECCTLVNKNVSIQSGQSMIMEQVSFMADRVVAWKAYKSIKFGTDNNVEAVL